jgi:Asp-tRNA(Asn)/Glu-tRNA(Gln) amidotransferase A subunit family amidase
VTQRLRAAGALVLGKTNLHEWCQGVTGHNHSFGPSRNPFDPTRVTGGSSGGNAALLGLRGTPMAIGTDTGGSVRVPAALCGLVGFRPTVRRWPHDGLVPISPTFDTAGVMARSVDDCVLADHAVAGGPLQLAATPLAGVRLGVPEAYFWDDIDPPVADLARATLARLREAGAVLVPCELAEAGALFQQGAMSISLYEILPALAAYFASHGRPFDARALADSIASPDVRPLFERPLGPDAITAAAYAHALHTLRPALQAAYRECFERHGIAALVFPTSPLTAARIGEDVELTLCGRPTTAFQSYIRNTGPAGMAGLPALSLPMGLTRDGLPAGIELTGRAGADSALLALPRCGPLPSRSPVGDLHRHGDVLLHQQHRGAARVDLADGLEHVQHHRGARPSEGSSSSSNCGRLIMRAADRHHLLLAARERAGRLRQLLLQGREQRQHLRHRLGTLRLGLRQVAAQLQVVAHAHAGEQAPALRHDGDAGPQKRWLASCVMSWPVEAQLPAAARCRPAMTLISVLLPAPFGPTTQTSSPGLHAQRHAPQRGAAP